MKKDMRRSQVIKVFDDTEQTLESGIWISGIYGEGEYLEWLDGKKHVQRFYKDGTIDGLARIWDRSGKLVTERVYKNGKRIK